MPVATSRTRRAASFCASIPTASHEMIADGLGISNGMGFSPDLTVFYHTDSLAGEIYAYDYHAATSEVTNRRILVKLDPDEGIPDGMTVDGDGNIWSATWGGAQIIQFDPDGTEMSRIKFPAVQTSAVMFGGEDLIDIYVTTAMFGSDEADNRGRSACVPRRSQTEAASYTAFGRTMVQGKAEFETDFHWS